MLVPIKKQEDNNENQIKKQEENNQIDNQTSSDKKEKEMICDTAMLAFEVLIEDFIKNQNIETIDQMHMILLTVETYQQSKFKNLIIKLLPFLKNKEFYTRICMILCDVTHFNTEIIDSLLKEEIFSKLDFSNKISFSLILSICDSNEKKAWEIFEKEYLRPEFRKNEVIQILLNKYS